MGLFRRREQTTVDYWGTPVTGDADRAQDTKGRWYRPAR